MDMHSTAGSCNSGWMISEEPSKGSSETLTVFVVDDDVSVRESLEPLIEHEGWHARTFASATAFLACPSADGPSCLVLDVSLPDLNGLDLQQLIAGERSEMPIIFITGHGDVPMSVRAMKSGAVEFLTKPYDSGVLLDAIKSALERSRSELSERYARGTLQGRYAALSRRESEVMNLVVAGLLNKQIAYELGISEITVKAHRGRMMHKMEARSLAELVKMSAQLEIATPMTAE